MHEPFFRALSPVLRHPLTVTDPTPSPLPQPFTSAVPFGTFAHPQIHFAPSVPASSAPERPSPSTSCTLIARAAIRAPVFFLLGLEYPGEGGHVPSGRRRMGNHISPMNLPHGGGLFGLRVAFAVGLLRPDGRGAAEVAESVVRTAKRVVSFILGYVMLMLSSMLMMRYWLS